MTYLRAASRREIRHPATKVTAQNGLRCSPIPDTLHTVCPPGALLGIRCGVCDHRAVLTIRRENMTRLRDLRPLQGEPE